MEEKKQIPEENVNAEMAELTDEELEEIVGGANVKIGPAGTTGKACDGAYPYHAPCDKCEQKIVKIRDLCGKLYYHCQYCGFTRNTFEVIEVMGDTVSDQEFWKAQHPGRTPVILSTQWIATGRAERI